MIKTKDQIRTILQNAYNDDRYILVGEQLTGPQDFPEDMLRRYREGSGGHMPAVLGLDLGIYGMDLLRVGIGTDRWNRFRNQAVSFAEQGGILTASHHWDNPSVEDPQSCGFCRGMFGDGTEHYWEELLTEGTEIHNRFRKDLLTAGAFLKELEDRGVPVLYRPLHEANGNWFWFTAKSCGSDHWTDGAYLKRLWRYIYELYTRELGLQNLIWVYSPNNGGGEWVKDVLYYYPGDDLVDMVGLDWYTAGKEEIYNEHHSYETLMGLGKVCAVCEFGPAGELHKLRDVAAQEQVFNALDCLHLFKGLTQRGMRCAYMLTWHTGYGALYSLGKAAEALADPFFCTLERMNQREEKGAAEKGI